MELTILHCCELAPAIRALCKYTYRALEDVADHKSQVIDLVAARDLNSLLARSKDYWKCADGPLENHPCAVDLLYCDFSHWTSTYDDCLPVFLWMRNVLASASGDPNAIQDMINLDVCYPVRERDIYDRISNILDEVREDTAKHALHKGNFRLYKAINHRHAELVGGGEDYYNVAIDDFEFAVSRYRGLARRNDEDKKAQGWSQEDIDLADRYFSIGAHIMRKYPNIAESGDCQDSFWDDFCAICMDIIHG